MSCRVHLQFSVASLRVSPIAMPTVGWVSILFSNPFPRSLSMRQQCHIKVVVLLAVEVPRAAAGLPPRLLPHLWGVGVERDTSPDGAGEGDVVGAGEVDWSAGEERARVAFLLLVNGLCLYVHTLVLFGLLSRLSATVFAITR